MAAVADRPTDAVGLAETAPKVPAMDSLDWYRRGWRLFRVSPWAWIGLWVVLVVIVMVVSLVPLAGFFLQGILSPVLLGGTMLVARGADRDGQVRLGDLFGGFRRNAGGLALIGLLETVAWLVLFMLAGIIAAMFIGSLMAPQITKGTLASPSLIASFAIMGGVVGLLNAPIVNACWLASGLVTVHDLGAMEALRRGFVATFRNLPALAMFVLFSTVFMLAAILPLFLGLFVFGPVLLGAMYAQMSDLFAPADPPAA